MGRRIKIFKMPKGLAPLSIKSTMATMLDGTAPLAWSGNGNLPRPGRGRGEVGRLASRRGDFHVYPTYGREHKTSSRCWCAPQLDHISRTGVAVWVHRVAN